MNRIKAMVERDFVNILLLNGGVVEYRKVCVDGHTYYELSLNNGKIRHWRDLSEDSLKRLGMKG